MNHPARISLYTDPAGKPAILWVDEKFLSIHTAGWLDAIAAIHEATEPDGAAPSPTRRPARLALFHHFNDERAVFADLNRIVEAHNALVDVVNTMNDIVETTETTFTDTYELGEMMVHSLTWIQTHPSDAVGPSGIAACDCGWRSDHLSPGAAVDAYSKHLPTEESETS